MFLICLINSETLNIPRKYNRVLSTHKVWYSRLKSISRKLSCRVLWDLLRNSFNIPKSAQVSRKLATHSLNMPNPKRIRSRNLNPALKCGQLLLELSWGLAAVTGRTFGPIIRFVNTQNRQNVITLSAFRERSKKADAAFRNPI